MPNRHSPPSLLTVSICYFRLADHFDALPVIASIALAFLLLPMCQYIVRLCTQNKKYVCPSTSTSKMVLLNNFRLIR